MPFPSARASRHDGCVEIWGARANDFPVPANSAGMKGDFPMSSIHDELAEACDLLERLTSRSLTLRRRGEDVTQDEIGVLRREIAFHEKVLSRSQRPTPPLA